ncbi:hypothetical protein [Jeotgalibacillus malaysiensis]|uniref:hypothetical protein n=1 Tax=Jeotgalibacillus malaysiensis TaxID=1508404 RepID=UPI003850DBA2
MMFDLGPSLFPLLVFFTYIAAVGFVIWFVVSLIRIQREKNEQLAKISSGLHLISTKLDKE